MAEEIDLGSLNFDTDKLAKSLLDVRAKIDEVRGSLSDNRKEMRETQKAINGLEKVQRDLKNVGQEGSEGYKNLTKEIESMRKSQVETTKVIIKQEQQVRILSKEQKTLTSILDANTKASDGNTAAIDRAVKASQEEVKTVAQARASNKELLKLRNELDISNGKNADKLKQLNGALDANNKFIKENVSAYEQQKIGIGDYRTAIEEAMGGVRVFNVSLRDVKGTFQQFKGVWNVAREDIRQTADGFRNMKDDTEGFTDAQRMAFVSMKTLTGGLKLLRVALISTGIGAIVVALGSLVTFLATTQRGIDAVTSVTRPLTTVMQTLLGVIQRIGGNVFDNPLGGLKQMYDFVKHQLIESFGALGKVIRGALTLNKDLIKEGVDQYDRLSAANTEAIKNVARGARDMFTEAYQRGQQIDRLTKQLSKSEADYIMQQAALKEELKEQNMLAEDQSKTLEEREAAAQRTIDISKQINNQQRERLELERDILLLKGESNDMSDQDRVDLAELNVAISESNAQQLEMETTQQNKLNAIRQSAATERKRIEQEATEAALELQQIELERFKLLNEGRQSNFDEEIQFARDVSSKRLEILDEEFKQGKKSKAAYELQKLQISQQAQEDEADVILFYSQQRINKEILSLERLRSERKRITQESIQDEVESLETLRQLKESDLQTQFDAGIISRREFNQALADLEIEKNEQIAAINAAYELQTKEDEKLSRMLDNEQRLLELRGFMEAEREIERQAYEEKLSTLEAQREEGLISEENYLSALYNLNEKHADALKKIDEARFAGKLKMASDTFGNLATIAGEESEAGKFFASAQATIDTYASAVAAYKSLAGINPILGAVAAAAAVSTGLRNVAKINSVDVGFYSGGYTGDGGMFERKGDVHAGEVVFSQADVQQLGGAANVESMRPTSDLFNDMPRGILQGGEDNSAMMAAMIGEAVERGSMRGTSKGVVDAEDDKRVKERARF